MGLTAFAIGNVLFSLATRDEQRSVFSLGVLEDRMFLMCTAGSLAAILFGTELAIFHRILGTVPLTLHQWLVVHRGRRSRSSRCPRPGGSCSSAARRPRREPRSTRAADAAP